MFLDASGYPAPCASHVIFNGTFLGFIPMCVLCRPKRGDACTVHIGGWGWPGLPEGASPIILRSSCSQRIAERMLHSRALGWGVVLARQRQDRPPRGVCETVELIGMFSPRFNTYPEVYHDPGYAQ